MPRRPSPGFGKVLVTQEIEYHLVEVKLPPLAELSFDQVVASLFTVNEDYSSRGQNYLTILKHEDIPEAQQQPWLFPIRQHLAVALLQKTDWVDHTRRMAPFTFCGQLAGEQVIIPGFPLKLFVSNHIEITLQSHIEAIVEHFQPVLDP